jgi:2-polyprenyl-6-methoxyphenol hydroxylase-like FAD-dependent oxidoreductase
MKRDQCTMRLTNLEQELKKALEEKNGNKDLISYEESVTEITPSDKGVSLTLASGRKIENVHIVINAEGFRSHTNELLGNRRITSLTEQTAVISTLEDDRPVVHNLETIVSYSKKTMRNIALAIHDHCLYLFLCVFRSEHFFSSSKKIVIAVTLKTPGQHQVSFGLSKKETENLDILKKQEELGEVPEGTVKKRLEFWTRMALCEVNVFSILAKLGRLFGVKEDRLVLASHLPIHSTYLVKVRSDHVKSAAIAKGKTLFLMTGDALSTVDPSTGLGCNTAIELSPHIRRAILAYKEGLALQEIMQEYTDTCSTLIVQNHKFAEEIRSRFAPDTLA